MTNVSAPGTFCANVAGPIGVYVNTGTAYAMEALGYTVNGVSISEVPFHSPIHSDEWGGDQGPPADHQLFGYEHRITFEMVHYSSTIMAKLAKFYNQIAVTAASATAAPGMLLGCYPYTFRCLLLAGAAASPTYVRNYAKCYLLSPLELSPVGSQASRQRFEIVSFQKAGTLPWDTDVTTP